MSREMTQGFEEGTVAVGVSASSGSVTVVTATPNKDGKGQGGLRYLQSNSVNTSIWYAQAFASGRFLRHYRVRYYYKHQAVNSYRINLNNTTVPVISVRVAGSGVITIHNQAGTQLGSASILMLDTNRYSRIEVEVYHAAAGFVRVYVDDDGSYTTPWVSFTGETRGTGGVLTTINHIGGQISAGNDGDTDDIGVNSLTLSYDGGVGAIPVAGDTVQVSGDAARNWVITAVEGTAVSGVLVIENPSATALPLADNTAITVIATGWTGNTNAPNARYVNGLEPQSMFPGSGYIVNLMPNGAGVVTQLTPSAGANWQCVDEIPPATGDYVSGTVDQLYDLYATGSLPASAVYVNVVQMWAYAQKDDATLNNCQLPLRMGGVTYMAQSVVLGAGVEGEVALPGSYGTVRYMYTQHPDGVSGDITVADVNASECGFRVRT